MAYMNGSLVLELRRIGFDWKVISGLGELGVVNRVDLKVVREDDLLELSVDKLVGWSKIRVRQIVQHWQDSFEPDEPVWPPEWEDDPFSPQALHGDAD